MGFPENKVIGFAYLIILLSYLSLASKYNETDPKLFRGYMIFALAYLFLSISYFVGDFSGYTVGDTARKPVQ